MSRVRARKDIRTAKGLLIAVQDTRGLAIRYSRTNPANYGKVAVRWADKHKVYWTTADDIEFLNLQLDPSSYVARAPIKPTSPIPNMRRPYRYSFGRNLREFRKLRQLSQAALAKLVSKIAGRSVTQTAVSYWERHHTAPGGVFLDAVASVLEIPAFLLVMNLDDCSWLEEATAYMQQLADKACGEVIF